ncbi:hypothetical protein [Pasteurella testudinis]|uniref:hypothetical protein n=1 Tax=Pasteurella testudinis TaxID=761 RepID=UPI004059028C
MSYHAVEDFVEQCVRLVAASTLSACAKRRLFYHLYHLQNSFDCSYTVLRCLPELMQYGFIRKLPLAQHPDFHRYPDYFAAHAAVDSTWLAADVANPTDEAVFSLFENGAHWILPQFGSHLWTRLYADGVIDEAGETLATLPLAELILQIVQLAHSAQDEILMKEAYLLFIECWQEGITLDASPFSRHFDDWLNDPTLLALREWAVTHQLLNIRRQDTSLNRTSLSHELNYADTPDAEAIVRWLLDLKTTPAAIAAKLAKAHLMQQRVDENLTQTAHFLENQMNKNGWQFASAGSDAEGKYYDWLWYRDNGEQQRILLKLSLTRHHKQLYARLSMQHPLLLQWQQRSPSTDSTDFHFKSDIDSLLPEQTNRNKEKVAFGWHYDLSRSWSLLQKKLLDSVLADIHTCLPLFEAKIRRYFPQDFFSRSAADYIALFDSEQEAMPDCLIIHSLENILLLLMFHAMQTDDHIQAQTLAAEFQQRYPQLKLSSRWAQIQPFLEAVSQGNSAPLPPFGSGFYHKL